MLRPLSISFEFFPPKTKDGALQLLQTAERLKAHHPHFFSVTFGAGGSTRQGTLETVNHLQQQCQIPVAPHLACIGATRDMLMDILQQYKLSGIKRIIALRGDLPSGMGCTEGEFQFASQLVSLIREVMGSHFHIEVAAYPEFHPQAQSVTQDILNLKKKYEAGANSAITQYFFNADAYFYYLDDCVRQGITMPIVPGIMPITNFNNLARFSKLCGAEIPRFILQRLQSYGHDTESILAFGKEVVVNLCRQLINGGAPGLHFYTLNKAEACLQILHDLNLDKTTTAIPAFFKEGI